MPLYFRGTDRVTCGTASTALLTDLSAGTYICWVQQPTPSPGRLISKGLAGSGYRYLGFQTTVNVGLNVALERPAPLDAGADLTSFAAFAVGQPLCVAGVFDINGTATDQRVYMGNLGMALREPSTYTAQTAGSGTPVSNSAQAQTLGNRSNNSLPMLGVMWWAAIYNRVLSPSELEDTQFSQRRLSGCVGQWRLGGNGIGAVIDETGYGNHGIVTTALPTMQNLPLPRRDPRRRYWDIGAALAARRSRLALLGAA